MPLSPHQEGTSLSWFTGKIKTLSGIEYTTSWSQVEHGYHYTTLLTVVTRTALVEYNLKRKKYDKCVHNTSNILHTVMWSKTSLNPHELRNTDAGNQNLKSSPTQ